VSKTSLLSIFTGIVASLAGQTVGSISGTLAGDNGAPLAAVITVNGVPPLRSSGSAKSSSNGAFTISSLPPGTYHICAEVGNGGYLDPCAWEPIPIAVQIATGQSITGYHLVAKRGVPLQVRINDAAGILTSVVPVLGGKAPPSLLIGVFSARNIFQPLVTTSADVSGMNKQITVPQNTPVRLHVSGQGMQIANGLGAVLSATGTISTVTANGTITFTVSAAATTVVP
jgi:hypothetical protein